MSPDVARTLHTQGKAPAATGACGRLCRLYSARGSVTALPKTPTANLGATLLLHQALAWGHLLPEALLPLPDTCQRLH